MKKKILIIGGNDQVVPLIKECNALGIKVLITDKDENCIAKSLSYKFFNIDAFNKEAILKVCKENNIDGILTLAESFLKTVSYVCTNLGLPGITEEVAQISIDKYLLKKRLKKFNIPTADYKIIKSLDELQNYIDNSTKYPIIIKPSDSGASKGVKIINNDNELIDAFSESLKFSINKSVILEEYLEGPEFSIETLTQNNITNVIAVTEKTVSGTPYCLETRHIVPAILDENIMKNISLTVKQMIKAIGANNCICHTEVKYTNKGPMIVETAARRGGDFIIEKLVPLATGVNMYSNLVKLAIGEKIDTRKTLNRYCGIQYIIHENYDKFLINKDLLKLNKDVVLIQQEHLPQDQLSCTYNNERLGYYICCNEERKEVEKLLDICKINDTLTN